MPRLIDDIRAARRFDPPFFVFSKQREWEKQSRQLIPLVANDQLPVLLIDNVADYMYTGTDQEYWSLDRDFPNLAPPFPAFWSEHRMPKRLHSKDCGDTELTFAQHGRVGLLVHAVDRDQAKGEEIPENTRWILWFELFIDYGQPNRGIEGPHGSIWMCVDEHGAVIGQPWMQSFAEPHEGEMMKSFMTWVNPTLLAISFLHCKNVTIVDNPVPPKLARRYRERHGGARMTGFKTLVIEPLKQILRTQGRSHEVGLAKALHICRGHFRDYRQGAGLFGKYHQLVWTPAVVRGSKGQQQAPPREIEVKV